MPSSFWRLKAPFPWVGCSLPAALWGSTSNQTSVKHVGAEQTQTARHQGSAPHPSSAGRGKESIQLLTRRHGGHLSPAGTAEQNRRIPATNRVRKSCCRTEPQKLPAVEVGERGAASERPRTRSIALRIPTSPWLRCRAPRAAHLAPGVGGRLLGVQAGVGHLDHIIQLPGLLLYFGRQEQRGRSHRLHRTKRREKPFVRWGI